MEIKEMLILLRLQEVVAVLVDIRVRHQQQELLAQHQAQAEEAVVVELLLTMTL
jgi:hypothetical protein